MPHVQARSRSAGMERSVSEPSNWEGATPERHADHRTTGSHRAWCLVDAEWCYPDVWCHCCHVAKGHVQVWLPTKDSDEYIQFAVRLHMKINSASDRGCVLEVLDALWEERE